MLELFAVRIKPVEPSVLGRLLHLVSTERRSKYERYRMQADAIRSLFAELVIRRIIIERCGISNDGIIFGANSYGKPELVHPAGLQFNVSHSGDWVVCALSDGPVGIDIEFIQPIDLEVSRRFFSPVEHAQLMELHESQQLERFYELWTLKESFVKAVGMGLSMPLDSFMFSYGASEGCYNLSAPEPYTQYAGKLLALDSTYKLAVCSSSDQAVTRLHHWSTRDWY
ncbi:4'-phosphopantetheinyl transferase [Paenibacillus cellulosilyticus]|uniref:4'-phosphopantetheinyl transferase n=1 Tax=Paenibacillus cellulosilyticus TaxID=375489 RepID=A0A2V2YWS0_9BACL|nr:4'-phosphopantetheinyl transferase superfamily protein [Paenibacillus cellulosilyticus]PWW05732.1 4'-phosphopantetheinyl transferase [Paenibacillus cellulosilyticus]QKS45255.1 4'-phosphopantetheinyl transferase superfamily protein [Paenibacillus cellulosilyticus]